MKVLVVGGSGYIGGSFAEYVSKNAKIQSEFSVDVVDSRGGWLQKDFAGFDSVIFAAGIAHRRQSSQNAHLYFEVNRDLAIAIAEKAKIAKVSQFVYLSSMSVYGKKQGEISAHTKPNPRHNDYYGTSKYQAEDALKNLEAEGFVVAIIRPPMVYGPNCRGKYRQLVKIAKFLPIVPCNKNKRSVIYIDNLSRFLCTVVQNRAGGIFCPQDEEYACTSKMVQEIRRQNGKKTVIIGMGWLVNLCMAIFPPMETAFGSLYYAAQPPFADNM
ncbi:MAG: NAD-dependent epimerase/dehydratase family protein [Defluviitaleaceae bacterium]|nr:NAD-dependent epimerase/dehydratase family protein [Defluviitaleaceae bacterium]